MVGSSRYGPTSRVGGAPDHKSTPSMGAIEPTIMGFEAAGNATPDGGLGLGERFRGFKDGGDAGRNRLLCDEVEIVEIVVVPFEGLASQVRLAENLKSPLDI